MRILALQLKRIGDLVLTAPALAALRTAEPDSHIVLGAFGAATELLSAFPTINGGIAFGAGRGWTPWQQTIWGGFDRVYDFTGNDRSALAAALSRAPDRVAFERVRRSPLRALAYTRFVDSSVRDQHTVDHYCDLVKQPAGSGRLAIPATTAKKVDEIIASGLTTPFAIVHPGTARAEKNWIPERWAEVIKHLMHDHGLSVAVTGGHGAEEADHLGEIARRTISSTSGERGTLAFLHGRLDLLTLAGLVERARIVLSCDTATVHLAASFERPQIALYGPINPFHWRPRHSRARVISAAEPDSPMTDFEPRMKSAQMERISTSTVIRATDELLASPAPLS